MEKEESLLFAKWRYWKQGIPAYQFRKERIKDIKEINDIDNIMTERENAAKELRNSMNAG